MARRKKAGKKKKKKVKRRCGKKTVRGLPCTRWVVKKGCCNYHQDQNLFVGNKNAVTHGFYCEALLPEEEAIYDGIPIGTIDTELRMLRIRLRRLLVAQAVWEKKHGLDDMNVSTKDMPVESHERHVQMGIGGEKIDSEGVGPDTHGAKIQQKTIRRKKDFSQEIQVVTNQIRQFEVDRAKLLEITRDEDFYLGVIRELREFTDQAAETMPGGEI